MNQKKESDSMEIEVYQCTEDKYIKMKSLGKLKYLGESFGVDGLTNNNIYDCVGISEDKEMLSIVDDSGENYMYSVSNPKPADGSSQGGIWKEYEIYDEKLKKVLSTQK